MEKNKSIFDANFEQAENFFQRQENKMRLSPYLNVEIKKKNLEKYYRLVDPFSRYINIILFWVMFGLLGFVTLGMPDSFVNHFNPSQIKYVNPNALFLFAQIANFIVFKIVIIAYLVWAVISYIWAHAVYWIPRGSLKTIVMSLLNLNFVTMFLMFTIFPIIFGLSIAGSGLIGFIYQILVLIYFAYKWTKSAKKEMFENVYNINQKTQEFETNLIEIIKIFIKKIVKKIISFFTLKNILILIPNLIIIGILILNSYTLKIGMLNSGTDNWQWIYGWLILLIATIIVGMSVKLVKNDILCNYYFIKYAQEFRVKWGLTNEQWYGIKRARRIARKKQRGK